MSVGANDGDDDADEDDNNHGEDDDDDDDKGEECDNVNGENDGMIGSGGLDERINDAVRTLKRECQKANIDCGLLANMVPKKGTDKEPFKEFWEAEGGQVSLATVRSVDFHTNVEALEEDPGFVNYNYSLSSRP